jgi:nitroreductase
MDLLQGINSRQSIRGFKSTPVPEMLLREVLQAAGRSPSYKNTQPWEVSIVSGAKRDALAEVLFKLASDNTPPNYDFPAPESWPAALDFRSKDHGTRRFNALGIGRDDQKLRNDLRLQNFKFFGAPCAAFFFMDASLEHWSTLDMGLFLQSFTLAAHGAGLGTCMQASVSGYPDAIRQCLQIPSSKKLIVSMSLGYPDMKAPINSYQSTRMDVDEFTTWHREL